MASNIADIELGVLNHDLTNEEYHGISGTYSSSQLKTILEDPEKFYKKYITKELEKEEGSHFDVGTYFHTAILEPHKLQDECAVFTGKMRSGKVWEDFKETNSGKAIITKSDLETCEKLINAVKASPVAMSFLDGAISEVSAFVKVYVFKDEVFTFRKGVCLGLTAHGWARDTFGHEEEDIQDFGFPIVLKVRADSLNSSKGVISDLKSTKGNVKSEQEMQKSVDNYNYDMSASLYIDIFSVALEDSLEFVMLERFIWIYASKDTGTCKCWEQDVDSRIIGRAMWKHAVILIAKHSKKKWKFQDELGTLPASQWKRHWLTKI